MRFQAALELHGRAATGIEVPDDVVAVMGGRTLIAVSAENRAAAGVSAGDVLDVELVLDTEKREVEVPAHLATALWRNPTAPKAFQALSYSNQSRHVLSIEAAKTAETRGRRIAKVVAELGG